MSAEDGRALASRDHARNQAAESKMNRRHFIRTSGLSLASVLAGDGLCIRTPSGKGHRIQPPDTVTAVVDGASVPLHRDKQGTWMHGRTAVFLKNTKEGLSVQIQAPGVRLASITLLWKIPFAHSSAILNDHWERTYGEVSWHAPAGSEILPWYFMETDGKTADGFGVKTGAGAFCSWEIGSGLLRLTLDTLSGGNGVRLDGRTLHAAEIVILKGGPDESPFECLRRFTGMMCGRARMPAQPVYGINDWYFAYGRNSADLILEHTRLLAPLADGLENRPFSVIDAGWFKGPPSAPDDCCWGDDMETADDSFGDMNRLAERIRGLGMRPGLWTRPLCGNHRDPLSLMLPLIRGREPNRPVLDPTLPENLERIRRYFRLYRQWGYELVKFDFTTFDILGKWGFEMLSDRRMTPSDWSMNDTSRTNAEILLDLYRVIRDAAGDTVLIGCNTIGHLSAGLFELNRIGDDTSGNEWERTRRMGVNALAFRGAHHGSFYAADADCVGLTTRVPWEKNRQWMALLAGSGTPLFISAQPEAVGIEQKTAIRDAFGHASRPLPLAEPLDWLENPVPRKWRLNGIAETFQWD
jgi:alpha-galactosidase